MTSEHFVVVTLAAIANLLLGVLVFLRAPRVRANQYFGVFCGSLALWCLTIGLVRAYATAPSGVFWARLTFASVTISGISFLSFVHAFPFPTARRRPQIDLAWLLSTALILFLSFTRLIAVDTTLVDGTLKVTYGPLHPIFGSYFIGIVSYALLILTRKWGASKGIQRLQVQYVFLGVFLLASGGIIANLIIPLMFRSSRFSPYGPLFTLFMSALIAHSIIRHRLMNTRLVIRRGVTYLLAAAAASTAFVAIASLVPYTTPSGSRQLPPHVELILVIIVALLFQPLKRWIQESLDSYVFREAYNYQKTVREISRTIASILDLESLLAYTCSAIDRTVRPDYVMVYGIDASSGTVYRRLALSRGIDTGDHPGDSLLPATSPIIAEMRSQRRQLCPDDSHAGSDHTPSAAGELRRLGADLALPIFEKDRLTGFFLIGPKLSGDGYFSEDIDLLTTLVSQAAVAIKNAQLYSQVVLANEYIENIVSAMDSAVIAVSAAGVVTLFNSAAERLTQLRTVNVKGALLSDLPPQIAEPLEATINDRSPQSQLETTIPDRGGRLTPVVCSTSTLRDRAGRVLGAVAVLSDLSRLKELESDKRRAERLASIGALAAGVAHEIKNPLVAIKTFAELLPERFSDEDFRDEFSKVVIREIDRIDGLVDRLRGLAAPRGRQLAPLDIRVPLAETLALLRVQLEQAGIRVATLFHADSFLVEGDVAQLKQLFLNLFVNAIEAMSPGGTLTIRIAGQDSASARRLLVEIEDTGSGIPDNLLGSIFDPFTTTKSRGSGLGLSICRGIADAHRATIQARNNRGGQGATVSLEFPAFLDVAVAAIAP